MLFSTCTLLNFPFIFTISEHFLSLPYQYFLTFFNYKAQRKHSKVEKLHSLHMRGAVLIHASSAHSIPVGSQRLSFVWSDRSLNLPSVLNESARSSVSSWHQPNIPSPELEHSFAIRFQFLSFHLEVEHPCIQVNCVSVHAWIFHPTEAFWRCNAGIISWTYTIRIQNSRCTKNRCFRHKSS